MRYPIILTLLALVLLVACSPKSVTHTHLEAALYQDGDLPAGWQAGQVSTSRVEGEGGAMAVFRELQGPGGQRGEVGVTLFEDRTLVDSSRVAIADTMGLTTDALEGLGDKAEHDGATVLWSRGRCVVVVSLPGEPDEAAITYAHRLDERLYSLVC